MGRAAGLQETWGPFLEVPLSYRDKSNGKFTETNVQPHLQLTYNLQLTTYNVQLHFFLFQIIVLFAEFLLFHFDAFLRYHCAVITQVF